VLGGEVRALRRVRAEVARVIVERVVIDVVDDFGGRERSAVGRLPREPVTHHPAGLGRVRVVGPVHLGVWKPAHGGDSLGLDAGPLTGSAPLAVLASDGGQA
jgi:hypothetical protein